MVGGAAKVQCSLSAFARSFVDARSSLRENTRERHQRAEDHQGLKADRADDPFENISLGLGELRLELAFESRQIRFGGEIVLPRFPQRFGERLGLLGGEMPFVPQRAGQTESIEKERAHSPNMAERASKVHHASTARTPRAASG